MVNFQTVPFLTGDNWIDGRPIWAVIVPFNQGPTNTNPVLLNHNILPTGSEDPSDFTMVDISGAMNSTPLSGGTGFYNHRPIPNVVKDPTDINAIGAQVQVSVGRQQVQLQSGQDWSGWWGNVQIRFVY